MNFGQALELIKSGRRVQREGWNGPNQYLYLLSAHGAYERCIVIYNAQRMHQPGWVPSQGDLFAEDWQEVTGL